MQTEKYCGICGQKLNIEFEYRKTAKTTCPRCESESEWHLIPKSIKSFPSGKPTSRNNHC